MKPLKAKWSTTKAPKRNSSMSQINHVWFDFGDTIASSDKKRHDDLRYDTYANMRKVSDTPEMRKEYGQLFNKYGKSNSNVFVQEFGVDGSFWPNTIQEESASGLFKLVDPSIPKILDALAKSVKISVFSNIDTKKVMDSLGINTSNFENSLSSAELHFPKPHIEGYKKIIELSNLSPSEILYIGDEEVKDIIPAKSVGLLTGIVWNTSKLADYNFKNFQAILDIFNR